MTAQKLKKYAAIFIAVIVGVTVVAGNFTYAGHSAAKKNILILNSYHKGYKWTDNIVEGISMVLEPNSQNVNVQIEDMDTKRISADDAYIQKLYEIYKYKFKNKKFDVIICSDDAAFLFLQKYQQDLFPDTPVVFCGVNNFDESEFQGHEWFTGIVETVDIGKTLDTALKLHPDTKHIAIVNDKTAIGLSNKRLLQEVIADSSHRDLDFIWLEDMNMSEVQERVAKLSDDSIILLLTFNQDKSNNIFSYEESIELIAQKATVPIYGVWDFYLGHGLVGGMLTNGFSQGELAAKLAQRILDGEKPVNIPVVRESPNRYIFDFNQLDKFKINPAMLPAGSVIVNKPVSFYEQHTALVWGVGLFITVLVTAICLLYVNIVRRKKVEQELKIYATTDTMTGVLNRRTGLLFLEEQMALADRIGNSLTICFIDVNGLKYVNDHCGHDQGDKLIKAVSQLLKEPLRKSDMLCRLGGDEFLIIFPSCTVGQAEIFWQRVEQNIASFNAAGNNSFTISVSYGFAEYIPGAALAANELVQEADTKMYQRKNKIKNTRDYGVDPANLNME